MKKPTRTRSPEIRSVTVPRLAEIRGGGDDWEAPLPNRRKASAVSASDDWETPTI